MDKDEASMLRKVAILYQALENPLVNGVRKPRKPGGYRDGGADVGYNLQLASMNTPDLQVITPCDVPNPAREEDWTFPDTETGIIQAIEKGANILWANTLLSSGHPLQTSELLDRYEDKVWIVGQSPFLHEKYDDKAETNEMLRNEGKFTLPRAWTVADQADLDELITSKKIPLPIVGKPVRGRGSYGVKVCNEIGELHTHCKKLFEEGAGVILEEFLMGEEATITVMPPTELRQKAFALPLVTRFDHKSGIAPYSGAVAVTQNSRALTKDEEDSDLRYGEIARECEGVSEFLRVTAPIRIDVRRFKDEPGSKFALFDVNMKPNMTGPGRQGREDQACLTAIAASQIGWDFATLLVNYLESAKKLGELRKLRDRSVDMGWPLGS